MRIPKIIAFLFVSIAAIHARAAPAQERIVERTYTRTLRYRCLVNLLDGYETQPKTRWPMILFLQGGGTPKTEQLMKSIQGLTALPVIVVAQLCPHSPDGPRHTNWNWIHLGEVVRDIGKTYRVDEKRRSVIGFNMGGSGAWELPSYEPNLFSKSVVIAGLCHPWSRRHYPKIPVWVFVGAKDFMRPEQQQTVASAKRFGVDVVETVWKDADHGGIFRNAMSHQRMLDWLIEDEDLRLPEPGKTAK